MNREQMSKWFAWLVGVVIVPVLVIGVLKAPRVLCGLGVVGVWVAWLLIWALCKAGKSK
jgi:hypothetical protein